MSVDEITEVFDVTPEEVKAVLHFASSESRESTSVWLMKVLFDNGTPNPIARSLTGHEVAFARRIGWHELENGEFDSEG